MVSAATVAKRLKLIVFEASPASARTRQAEGQALGKARTAASATSARAPPSGRFVSVTSPPQRAASDSDHGEAEPGAARAAATRRPAVEALEHALALVGVEAGALVEHREPDRLAVARPGERDRAARGRVVEGVLGEVVEDRGEVLGGGGHDGGRAGRDSKLVIRALGRALPAGAGGLDELGHVERLGRGPLGATGQGEQLGEEPGEPLGLVLGGGELALDLGVAALERRGLETKAKARERRAQLVRGVRDEVALVAKRGRHASGHVVERGGHLPLLGGALHARAGVEVAVRNAPRRAGQSAQGLGERAGEEPRHHEAEQQRQGAHAREREHVVALLGLHGVDALGHPHRARRPAVHRHGDGGEEEVLVQQVAVALALGRLATGALCWISGREP